LNKLRCHRLTHTDSLRAQQSPAGSNKKAAAHDLIPRRTPRGANRVSGAKTNRLENISASNLLSEQSSRRFGRESISDKLQPTDCIESFLLHTLEKIANQSCPVKQGKIWGCQCITIGQVIDFVKFDWR